MNWFWLGAAALLVTDASHCTDEVHQVNLLQSHKHLELSAKASAANDPKPLIPRILTFNDKHNLLEGEDCPAKRNVLRIMEMHPDMDMLFYNDTQCREAIVRVHSEELARYFDAEPMGFFKSDTCRVAMLIENGGFYFDTDVEVVQNVADYLPWNASFASASAGNPVGVLLHQGFIASVPGHQVLKDSLTYTLEFYKYNEALGRSATKSVDLRTFPSKYDKRLGIGEGVESWTLLGPMALGMALMDWADVGRLPPGGRLHSGDNQLAYLFNQSQPQEGINETYGFAWRGCEGAEPPSAPPKYPEDVLSFCNIALVDVERKELLSWKSSMDDCCA